MSTYRNLTAEIARLQAQADKLRDAEKAGVIGRIREAISVYGISADDLGLSKSAKGGAVRGAAVTQAPQFGVAKYRDPATGKTWTGRGKPPAWIAGAKDRSAFLIASAKSNGAEPAVVAKGRGRRSAAAAKTVGEPKYRDAATGKTWTGRGKPPLWIAGVEDRTPYLIKP
ncbi:H-NS histone family protein [Aquincola sp. S2]|uniref:H-NS histone family protein n=1 Tax=Pseudaquabacterium terrae TaxID=2732868 RepID=A0ABX2ES17_9BURK|nr:H-NS family nucleoid-associated regulatory protein [Aquabacterium terrae]NRF71317.1 H-NS histone family protein [Aquabacterium terrae]